ncbi:MAG: plastocyanin/azurin family copper-binding protein [Pseudomonadota bacterium]
MKIFSVIISIFLLFSAMLNNIAIAAEVEVIIKKFKFIPAEITINRGDKIIWINKEKRQYHSVWFEQAGDPEADYFFPDESYSRTFATLGSLPYRCGPHPEMTGIVHVIDK